MDSERKEFEAWLDSFDPRNPNRPSTTLERNEAWRAWQARAEQSRAECEALRKALAEIKDFVCGSSVPRWDTTDHTYASREAIANRIDAAMGKEKV